MVGNFNKKTFKLSVVLSSILIGSTVYITGCGGGGGGGGGGGTEPNLSICSTPIEASLSSQVRIGGATTSVELHGGWTLYNVANELRATLTATPESTVGLEVEGYIQDIEIVEYDNETYALLGMGEEGISVVNISNLPTMTLVQDGLKVNYFQDGINWTEGSGTQVYDNNISGTRGAITSLAVYNDGNASTPLELIIGDEKYGLHKTSLSNVIDGNVSADGDGTLLIDGEEQYTLQYAGENPWGGPKSLTLHGEGNNTKLFVAQGFLGMGIYDPKTLEKVGRYNLYIDATEANGGEDWFYDMDVSEAVHDYTGLDLCTGMPNYHQASYEITEYKNNKNIDTPWADFEFRGGKYYYDARKIDVVTANSDTTAYIAYGNAGLVAVDVTGYEDATARTGVDCSTQNNFLEATYLGYVPAIPSKGPDDRIIGKQTNESLFTQAGSGMLKDSGVVDVKVDTASNKVFYTDHFGGLMVVDNAADPSTWGVSGTYDNDTNESVEHVPSYDFVTSYDMTTPDGEDEALPNFTTQSPILLATSEVGGHGNSLVLTGNSFDEDNVAPADVVMAAGAGGLNFIEVYGTATTQYDFNVTAQFATTSEVGADQNGDPTVALNVGHAAGVGTYDNLLYLADGPHGMTAWEVADTSCKNYALANVHVVGNTIQGEGIIDANDTDLNTTIYPTPHADEVLVINDGVTKSALVSSLSTGLRRVNVNNMGTVNAPELLYPTAGDIYEHSGEDLKVGGLTYEDRVYSVAVSGDYAFTADGLSGVTVYDLSKVPDTTNASGFIVDNIKVGTNATDIALWYNSSTGRRYAFVAVGSKGISVLDVTDPSNLIEIRTFQPIKWEDENAHNADGVAISVKVVGSHAFFTYDSYGVLAYNITDLINPNDNPDVPDGRYDAVGHFKLQNDPNFADWSGGAKGIDAISVGGNTYIYVAYGDAGAIKIDWTDPTNPILVQHANTAGSANDIVVWNGRVYVADGAGGLVLFE